MKSKPIFMEYLVQQPTTFGNMLANREQGCDGGKYGNMENVVQRGNEIRRESGPAALAGQVGLDGAVSKTSSPELEATKHLEIVMDFGRGPEPLLEQGWPWVEKFSSSGGEDE